MFVDYINKELNRRNGKKSIMDYVDEDDFNEDNYQNNNNDDEENNSNDSRIVKNFKEKQSKSFVFEI